MQINILFCILSLSPVVCLSLYGIYLYIHIQIFKHSWNAAFLAFAYLSSGASTRYIM